MARHSDLDKTRESCPSHVVVTYLGFRVSLSSVLLNSSPCKESVTMLAALLNASPHSIQLPQHYVDSLGISGMTFTSAAVAKPKFP